MIVLIAGLIALMFTAVVLVDHVFGRPDDGALGDALIFAGTSVLIAVTATLILYYHLSL